MFTNRKPTALDELSKKMLEQGYKDIQARRMVNETLGINDKSQLPREHLDDWNRRFEEARQSLNEGVESKPENLQELSKHTLDSYVVKAINSAIANVKNPKKFAKRAAGADLAAKKLALKEERPDDHLLPEEDEGKPGKNFAKIAAKAAKEYGSKEAGERVAGAIRKKVLEKEKSVNEERSEKRTKGIDKALKKFIKEALDKNAGIEASKVNKELKVGFNWTNGKGQSDTKKADSDAEISTPPKTPIETGSKSISPAVMESLINEMLTNKPELIYSDFVMESAFGDAFKAARLAGKTEFSFGGKSYNTRQKGETDAQWRANVGKNNVAPTPQSRPVAPDNNKTTDAPNVAIRPETNPASVAAKRTVGMEGPGQSTAGPSTPASSLTGAIQKATSIPSSVPPPPVRDVGGPSNVRPQPNNIDVRSQVSNSINPPSETGPSAGLQQALNLKAATLRKAGEMASAMNEEEKREVSLIESILSQPKIDMGASMFGNEVSM